MRRDDAFNLGTVFRFLQRQRVDQDCLIRNGCRDALQLCQQPPGGCRLFKNSRSFETARVKVCQRTQIGHDFSVSGLICIEKRLFLYISYPTCIENRVFYTRRARHQWLLMFQMSEAYSAIVRSLENLPVRATFKIALRVQTAGSRYCKPAPRWAFK